jgi:hypothetical protein
METSTKSKQQHQLQLLTLYCTQPHINTECTGSFYLNIFTTVCEPKDGLNMLYYGKVHPITGPEGPKGE